MRTTVTSRGRATIPAEIRRRHGIESGDRLAWLDDGTSIKVIPLPADQIRALHGIGRGEGLLEALLAERKRDRERE